MLYIFENREFGAQICIQKLKKLQELNYNNIECEE